MRFTKLLPFIAVIGLIISCFLPWMTIESKGITISGVNTTGTSFGRPGYFHFVWVFLYLLFLLINRVWSKRSAIGLAGFNMAWALRNFLLIPACQMGECPVKEVGLYLLVLFSFVMFIGVLLYANQTDRTQ